METLIRYRVQLGLIWFCTVYLYPTKRTLGLCGLIALYEKKCLLPCLWNEEKPDALPFFLGIFFLRTLDCLVSYGPRCEKTCLRGKGLTKSVSNQSPQLIETSLKNEISPAASLHMILSKKRIKRRWSDCADAQAGLRLCCSQTPRRQGFLRWGPYYSCIYDPCNSEWTVTHGGFFNSHRKFIFFCWIVSHFIFFTKQCLANKRSSPRTYIWGGGG